jgi:hypothetical protein
MKHVYPHRALLVVVLCLFFFGTAGAQQLPPGSEVSDAFYQRMNHVFSPLEKNRVPHGLLRDFAMEFVDLEDYNGVSLTQNNWVDKAVFTDVYQTLFTSRIHTSAGTWQKPTDMDNTWHQQRVSGRLSLAGLCYRYANFRPDARSANLVTVSNDQIYDRYVSGVWQNPYQTNVAVALAPAISSYKGRRFEVVLPSATWFSNQQIGSIQLDPSDGGGYRTLTLNQPIIVHYADTGMVEWKYRVTLTSGQQLNSHSRIHIDYAVNPKDDQIPTAYTPLNHHDGLEVRAVSGIQPFQGQFAFGTITIRYMDPADHRIRRPLIVAEGYDPGHILSPEARFGSNDIEGFLEDIRLQGPSNLRNILIDNPQYDLIYVDWARGTDNLIRNAQLLKEVIRIVNREKVAVNGVRQPNVLLGQSMGGVITRIALRQMELDGEQHDTRLYISHDAPHQGANTPLAFQHFARHARALYISTGTVALGVEVIQLIRGGISPVQVLNLANQPGSRQMLINYVNAVGLVDNTEHNTFRQQLTNLGYPTQTRNVAISNGSECAQLQEFGPKTSLLSYVGRANTRFLGDLAFMGVAHFGAKVFPYSRMLNLGRLPGRNEFHVNIQMNALANGGGNQVYAAHIRFVKSVLYAVPVNVVLTHVNINAPTGLLPIDSYPGGWYPIPVNLQNSSTRNWFFQYNIVASNQRLFNFVPRTSSLDVGAGGTGLTAADFTAVYAASSPPPSPKQIPFANFVVGNNLTNPANSINERHISFTRRNADWTGLEMQNPTGQIFDCTYACRTYSVAGNNLVCSSGPGSNQTFALQNFPGGAVTWTASSNLTPSSGTGTTATVSAVAGASGSGQVTFTIAGACGNVTISKETWVGTSSATYFHVLGGRFDYNLSGVNNRYFQVCPEESLIYIPKGDNIGPVTEYQWEVTGSYSYVGSLSDSELHLRSGYTPGSIAYFRVRMRNGCNWGPWQDGGISVNNCDGGEEPYIVYPNPTADEIHISNTSFPGEEGEQMEVHLYNQHQKLVRAVRSGEEKIILDVRSLPTGPYFLHLTKGQGTSRRQIFIRR